MPIDEIEVVPDPTRVMEGLRDTGYEFTTAVADIVDNSVAAEASRIIIRVGRTLDGDVEVSIADNGTGMDRDGLIAGMRYGSPERPHAKSLGKFGLGLKTAGTSLARQLTVTTRWSDGSENAAVWDLNHVAQTGKWMLQLPSASNADLDLLDEASAGKSGTVVVLREVDRLVGSQKVTDRVVQRQVDALRDHLGLTYCRYITGEAGQTAEIVLNGQEVSAWDPFGRDLGAECLFQEVVPVDIDGAPAEFTVRAWVLPPKAELTPEQQEAARILVRWQGFYVFREDRVIVAGDWLGMYSAEPHANLCRFELSFDHRLDDALQIDIKKSRIRLLAALQDEVKQKVTPSRFEAQERYRKNQRTQATVEGGSIHDSANRVIGGKADHLTNAVAVTVTGEDEAEITNPKGSVRITIPTRSAPGDGPHVLARDDVPDGLLWRPGIVNGQHAVLMSVGHPFYERFYRANEDNPVAVQGADYLLWALCEAELFALSENEKEHMSAVRREVSRILRELAKDMPEPSDE